MLCKKQKGSQTALKVALNIIALGHLDKMKDILPGGIINSTSELLYASNATSKRRIDKHHSPKILNLYKKFDWMMPGQFEVFGYRKSFFDRCVIEAINKGATQVLMLGAGYDTLALRLSPKFDHVKFFEIDHPSTALQKLEGIIKLGKSKNHYVIPEDLSKTSLTRLLADINSWDSDANTVITAEGLLQYLTPNSVEELFKQCYKISGNGSRMAFTFIGKGKNGRPYAGKRSRLILWLLMITGEPWLWAADQEELINLLNNCGWKYAPELIGGNFRRGIEYFGIAAK